MPCRCSARARTFDVAQDSVVRVYVHKLRRRLEEFATRSLTPYDGRITIPKGEYRLVLEPGSVVALPFQRRRSQSRHSIQVAPPSTPGWRRWLKPALAAVAAFVAGVVVTYVLASNPQDRDLNAVRHSAVWAPLLDDDLPITVVVGDYFLLGEVDHAGNVERLVREFYINSNQDFLDHLQLNPGQMSNYRNLDLTYLPLGDRIRPARPGACAQRWQAGESRVVVDA